MADKPPIGPEHSRDREFTVILEDIRSQFRVFGEGLTDVQEKVADISERLERVEQDVTIIKSVITIIPTLATKKDIEKLTERITTIESR